jgi:hypothetical protein
MVVIAVTLVLLRAAPDQGSDTTMRDLWLTVQGKEGVFKTVEGRVIFAYATNGPNGPFLLESVGRDYVTIAAGTAGTRNLWRYTIPMDKIELHIFR